MRAIGVAFNNAVKQRNVNAFVLLVCSIGAAALLLLIDALLILQILGVID